jgi:LVIVD repeat
VLPNGAIGARLSPDGDTLYLTDATGLGIYDVSNPASPQIRSHVPLPRIAAEGGLHLVDVSDPGAPAIVATRPALGGLTVYDVRDLSRPAAASAPRSEELAWVCGDDRTFAFDVTDPDAPRLVLGGPGAPLSGHCELLGVLARRPGTWARQGAPVGFYVSADAFWGAYLAPDDCPPLGSRGRSTGRMTPLSPIGEWDRPASWGRGSVPSPAA